MDPFHTLRRRRRLRERLKTAFGVTLTVIVCGLLIAVGLMRAGAIDLPTGVGGGTAADAADAADGQSPPGTPFEGTPAADFGEFDDLEFPKAKATRHFDKQTVADALKSLRSMLKAGRVDWPEKPQKPADFAERFAPSLRDDVMDILSGPGRLGHVSALLEGRSLVAAPRVSGTFSVNETIDANTVRSIEIRADLVWAYAFDGPLFVPGDNLLVLNTQQVWEFTTDDEVRAADVGLWPREVDFFAQNVECGHFNDGYLSSFRNDPAQSGDGSGAYSDPDPAYEPGVDLSTMPDDCA